MTRIVLLALLLLSQICYAQKTINLDTVKNKNYSYTGREDNLTLDNLILTNKTNTADINVRDDIARETKSRVHISNFKVEDLSYKGDHHKQLFFYSDTINTLKIQIGSDNSKKLGDTVQFYPSGCKFGKLSFLYAYINRLYFHESVVRHILFDNITFIDGKKIFEKTELPDTISFKNVHFESDLYLTSFDNNSNKTCQLIIENTDCSKLYLYYSNFHLAFLPNTSNDQKAFSYQQLLNIFKERGLIDSYEKLDKEYQEFKYHKDGTTFGAFKNCVDRVWWDYGYDKLRTVWISFLIYGLLFLLNYAIYDTLLKDGYSLKQFRDINEYQRKEFSEVKRFFYKIPFVILYTGYIFWGLKLNFDKLHVHRFWIFFIILVQYIVGVICLAYIANFIISR